MRYHNSALFLSVYKKFREYLFPKGVLIYQEKAIRRSNYFSGDYDWGVGISVNKYWGVIF